MKYVMRVLCVRTLAVLCMALALASAARLGANGSDRNGRGRGDRLVRGRAPRRVRPGAEHGHQRRPRDDDRRAGSYRAAALQPGRYEVSAALSGFSVPSGRDIQVRSARWSRWTCRPQPAGVTETVSVTTDAPLVDTTRTDVSQVIGAGLHPEPPHQRPPVGQLRAAQPGRHQRRQLRPGELPRHLRPLQQQHGRRRRQQPGLLLGGARAARARCTRSAPRRSRSSRSASATCRRSSGARPAARSTPSPSRAPTPCRARASTSCATRRSRRRIRSSPDNASGTRSTSAASSSARSSAGRSSRDKVFFFGSYDQQVRDRSRRSCSTSASRPSTTRCTASAANCAATTAYYQVARGHRATARRTTRSAWQDRLGGKPGEQLHVQLQRPAVGLAERHQHAGGAHSVAEVSQRHRHRQDRLRGGQLEQHHQPAVAQRVPDADRPRLRGADAERRSARARRVTGGINFGMPNFLPRPKYPYEQRYQFLDSVTFYSGAHTIKSGFDVNFVKEELQNLFQGGGVYSYSGLYDHRARLPGARAASRLHAERRPQLHHLRSGVRPERPGRRARVQLGHLRRSTCRTCGG